MGSQIRKRLKYYRELRKMGQAELAELMGMAPNTISKIEHGCRKLTFEEAVQLAEILHVELHELAGLPSGEGHAALVLERFAQRTEAIVVAAHALRDEVAACQSYQ